MEKKIINEEFGAVLRKLVKITEKYKKNKDSYSRELGVTFKLEPEIHYKLLQLLTFSKLFEHLKIEKETKDMNDAEKGKYYVQEIFVSGIEECWEKMNITIKETIKLQLEHIVKEMEGQSDNTRN